MKLRHLYLSSAHIYVGHHGQPPGEELMQEMESVECVAAKGIVGDRYFGHKEDYKGQITFFAEEVYERLCELLGETGIKPSVFRRNVITRGVDLNTLIGQEFEVQGVRFVGVEECKPCYWMNRAFAEGAEAALCGSGGLRARILSSGVLHRDA